MQSSCAEVMWSIEALGFRGDRLWQSEVKSGFAEVTSSQERPSFRGDRLCVKRCNVFVECRFVLMGKSVVECCDGYVQCRSVAAMISNASSSYAAAE